MHALLVSLVCWSFLRGPIMQSVLSFFFGFRLSCRRALFARETISRSMVGNGPIAIFGAFRGLIDRFGEDREDSYGGQQVAEWNSSIAVYSWYAGTGMVMDGSRCREFSTLIGLKTLVKVLTFNQDIQYLCQIWRGRRHQRSRIWNLHKKWRPDCVCLIKITTRLVQRTILFQRTLAVERVTDATLERKQIGFGRSSNALESSLPNHS